MFCRQKDSMKNKCYVFRSYKQINKLCFVDLESKLQQDGYFWYIFKSKCYKTEERTYLQRMKQ